jgi:hypothetical protein
MKIVKLTQGKETMVDDDDYDRVMSEGKWYADWNAHTKSFYARRQRTYFENGVRKQYPIRLSRFIMGIERGDKILVDHCNHNTLDNQKCNLRLATESNNSSNKRVYSNNKSGFIGVSWRNSRKKWVVQARKDGKPVHLGYFNNKEDAAGVYDMFVSKNRGAFAKTNLYSNMNI